MLKRNSSKTVGFRSLIDTAEAEFGNFRIEFLGEHVTYLIKKKLLKSLEKLRLLLFFF
jgi:hypothetical protein